MDDTQRPLDDPQRRTGLVVWLPGWTGTRRFALRGIGLREGMPPAQVVREHGTDDWLFMHFHDRCELDSGRGLEPVGSGTCVWWRPGSAHRYGTRAGRWTHSWMHVRGEAVAAAIAEHRLPTDAAMPGIDEAALAALWPLLIRECTAFRRPDGEILESLLGQLALQLRRAVGAAGARIPEAIAEARAFIDRHHGAPVGLDGLARRARLPRRRFDAEFRRWIGATPLRYLQALRMKRAAHLLLDANATVAAVAAEVGFDDAFYFSRVFKRHHGVAPDAWRRGR